MTVVLRQALQIAERALDQQLAAIDVERQAAEGTAKLGIASLAGSLAVAGLIQQSGLDVDVVALSFFVMGVALQVLAISGAAFAANGAEAVAAPEPGDMYSGLAAGWGLDALLLSVLEGCRVWYRRNRRVLEDQRRRTIRLRKWLVAGAASVAAATLLIVGGAISV